MNKLPNIIQLSRKILPHTSSKIYLLIIETILLLGTLFNMIFMLTGVLVLHYGIFKAVMLFFAILCISIPFISRVHMLIHRLKYKECLKIIIINLLHL